MAVIDTGNSTAGQANVDGNYRLQVNAPTTASQSGFVSGVVETDSGAGAAAATLYGTRTVRSPNVSQYRRTSAGLDQVLFSDSFAATAQNTALWKSLVNTFAAPTFSSGYLNLNSSGITTSASAQVHTTYRTFSLFGDTPVQNEFSVYLPTAAPSNAIANIGMFLQSGSTPYTPTDGVYIRINSSGVYGCLNFNGTETATLMWNQTTTALPVAQAIGFKIICSQYLTEYWISTVGGTWVLMGTISTPNGNGTPILSMSVPGAISEYFSGTAGTAWAPKISQFTVTALDTVNNKPWPHVQAGAGLSAYQGQNGGTMGTTAFYANSAAPGAGSALSNTATLVSGLGGQAAFTPTLAANTDGIMTSYLNPLPTATQPGRVLYITGVKIQSAITTALVAGPVMLEYSLAFGHNAVSLATTEAAAAKAPRRIALGWESYAAGTQVITASATNGTTTLTLPYITNIAVGAAVSGAGIASGVAIVTGIAANVVTIAAGSSTITTLTTSAYTFMNNYGQIGPVSNPSGVFMPFASPVVVNPGEYIATVAKNVGAVTTAGVITAAVTFDGYFE